MSGIYNDVINEYNNTGTTRYAITFEYDYESQVKVRYYDSTTNEYVYVTDWEFDGATAIRFTDVVPDSFQILRETDISQSFGTAKFSTFVQGGAIRASDLNGDFELLRQAIEEGDNINDGLQDQIDDINDGIDDIQDQIDGLDDVYVNKTGDTMTGVLSMSDNKITNLGDPVDLKDAVNRSYVDNLVLPGGDVSKVPTTRFSAVATSQQTVVPISPSFAPGQEIVFVNGAEQSRDTDYTAETGGASITFTEPLHTGDVIDLVAYNTLQILNLDTDFTDTLPYSREAITATAGQTTFVCTQPYSVGKEQVYMNGSLLTRNIDYTASDRTNVILTVPAFVGDIIEVHSGNYIATGIIDDPTELTYIYPGGVQQTVQDRLEQYVSVKDFGAKGDGSTDDTAAIQLALDSDREVFFPQGTYIISSTLNLSSNTGIIGDIGVTIKANSSMSNMLKATTKSYLSLKNIKFDANQKVSSYALNFADGCTDVTVDSCEIINWTNALRVASNTTQKANRIKVVNNYIYSPASTNVYYPLSIQSTTGGLLVANVDVSGNIIVGTPGKFTAANNCTADQINLQGVEDFTLCNNISINGGEMGITVSRLSQRGIISGNVCKNCDSHGINIGSGYFALRASAPLSVGASATSPSTPEWSSTVQTNFTYEGSDRWYGMNSTTGGFLQVGDTINDGVNNTRTVQETWYTNSISCSGNNIYNCAIDVGVEAPSSGIFVQQTNSITVVSNQISDEDSNMVNGVDVRQSSNSLVINNTCTGFTDSSIVNQGTVLTAPSETNSDLIVNGDIFVGGLAITPKGGNLKLSSNTNGSITPLTSYARVDTDSSAASGTLSTIVGSFDGQRLVLMAASAARTVTLVDRVSPNPGNLKLAGDFNLDNTDDTISLIYNGNTSAWHEISRSDNNS